MSCSDEKAEDNNDKTISSASHYALQIAFQSLKERFDSLRKYSDTLQKDNSNLKSIENDGEEKRASLVSLEEKIQELERQKQELSHHIFLIATENKNLWSKLDLLKVESEKLKHELTNHIFILVSENQLLWEKLGKLNEEKDYPEQNNSSTGDLGSIEDSNESPAFDDESNIYEESKIKPSLENHTKEDEDSDLSITTVKECCNKSLENSVKSSDQDDNDPYASEFQDDMDEILQKLKYEKLMLQQLQDKLQERFNSALKIVNDRENSLQFNVNKVVNASYFSNCFSKTEERSNGSSSEVPKAKFQYDNSPTILHCPLCNKLLPFNDVNDESLLNSFEVIVCDCQS